MAFNNAVNATQTGVQTISTAGAWTGSTFSQYTVLIGGASNAISTATPSATSGVPLISQGSSSNPVFGTAVVAGGGTGSTSFTTYGPVVAASTSTGALTSVSPSATAGVPFVSGGSSANPSFTTAVVAGGGTGATTFTAYAPIIAGTTSTGAFQSASTGLSTSGFVLTSNGSSAVPSFQAVPSSGGGITWATNATTTIALTSGNGYITTSGSAITATLPTSSAAVGTMIGITVGAAGMVTVGYSVGQNIQFGSTTSTTLTGSIASNSIGDTVILLATVAASGTAGTWQVIHSMGNWTIV